MQFNKKMYEIMKIAYDTLYKYFCSFHCNYTC